ncbi:hypothetical protein [Bradyrhizobium sp. SBR1B]|uniref:hypothetical protein n=1 Tax=Bradyrhizobium sp. SBR1B TaxID=2663836 RepID=UPI001606AE15|nr:hypothetical protein [Bradyrhizobium sp. SBR1B]MBB4375627.1 hypothetical protein [Bradyrhizobium sp. SBR1B]
MSSPAKIGRRRFLGRAAAVLAGTSAATPVALTAALAALTEPAETAPASTLDATLLALEERIFQHKQAAEAFEPEMDRLDAIMKEKYRRLYDEAWAAGTVTETHDRRLEQLSGMPEHVEQCRLCELQDAHWRTVDELVGQMWNIPAQTPEGRRSKLSVLLGCILGEEWRHPDEDDRTSYEVLRARSLLIELVGGEPSKQLRDQFI